MSHAINLLMQYLSLIGYRVKSNSGVYSAAPSLTVVGDGTGANAHAILDNTGKLAAVQVGTSSAVTNIVSDLGSGYNQASITVDQTNLTSVASAEVFPIFAVEGGIGADARSDLRSTSIMFNIKPEGDVSGDWIVDNEYRQIGLLKNIKQFRQYSEFDLKIILPNKKIKLIVET